MRNMSASLTTAQCYAFTKTVTRRNGWWNIKPLEIIQLIEKGQGLKKGEHIKKIHKIVVLDSRSERLDKLIHIRGYGEIEMSLEGFPGRAPADFIEMYCRVNKTFPEKEVNRIEFRYLLKTVDGLQLKVPQHIAVCPACGKQIVISPDGFYATSVRRKIEACGSFTMWCAGELENTCVEFSGISQYRYPLRDIIEAWLLNTFRFEK